MVKEKDSMNKFWEENKTTLLIISLIIILAIGAILYPKKPYPSVSAERLAEDPFLGAADAPFTIIEYGDFACSSCKMWHWSGVLDEILELFDGQVKFVWRDNARLSTASISAANAAQCAFDQGTFWEYHELLFDNSRGFSNEGLKVYAVDLGLDSAQFNLCLDQGTYVNKVFHSMNLAGENGLSVTPAFLVNDEVIIGPPPTSYLSDLITEKLNDG